MRKLEENQSMQRKKTLKHFERKENKIENSVSPRIRTLLIPIAFGRTNHCRKLAGSVDLRQNWEFIKRLIIQ